VAAFARRLQADGLSAAATAALLDVPARTLRLWQGELARPAAAACLGRPHVHGPVAQADAVIAFLHA
jgi:hypothetical protein